MLASVIILVGFYFVYFDNFKTYFFFFGSKSFQEDLENEQQPNMGNKKQITLNWASKEGLQL